MIDSSYVQNNSLFSDRARRSCFVKEKVKIHNDVLKNFSTIFVYAFFTLGKDY